jgi:hypothetical protein
VERLDLRTLLGTTQSTVIDGQGFFPVIAAVNGDDLLVALRGGAGHVGLGGRLDVVRSTDGGRSWSPPVTVADSDRDDRNPALGMAADGSVVLAYLWQGSYDADGRYVPSLNRQDTRVVRSPDGGSTWTEDRVLDFAPLDGASPYGKIRGVAGVLHMPIYTGAGATPQVAGGIDAAAVAARVEPATSATCLLRSADGGRTWGDPTLVALGLNEADFLLLPNGDWLFAGRSEARDRVPASAGRPMGSTAWSAGTAAARGTDAGCSLPRGSRTVTAAIPPRPACLQAVS